MAKKFKSIITQDLEHCYLCGAPEPQIHHIFNGANKKKSEKYGLIIPLCMYHHTGDDGVHTVPEQMKRFVGEWKLYYDDVNQFWYITRHQDGVGLGYNKED